MSNISILKKELSQKITKLNRLDDNVEINKIVEELIVKITHTEFASIWIYDFPMLLRTRETGTNEIFIDEKKGLLYECFAKKQAVIYNYLSSEKGYIPHIDNPDNIKIKSKIIIPLIDENQKFIGIATAYSSIKKIKKFTNDDLKIFQAISPFIIESINKMKQNSNIEKLNNIKRRDNDIQNSTEQDINKNLDKLEETLTDIKAPNEMLEYVSNIVHDIRTPANGLLGFLEILQEQIQDNRLQEYVNHAKNSALLINELTTSILNGVSNKREVPTNEPTLIETDKFFADIAGIFSANMFKKNINYNVFIDPLVPKEITIDSMKTKRVVMNLIGNASKFTPENGSIEFSIRYKVKEKKLHIFVKDNGIGIAKDKQSEIFEAFKQAEDNTKDIYGGTGLGLSICASYVKDLGGKLLIESELNKGSTFYFDIPLDVKEYTVKFKPLNDEKINIAILMTKENSFVANHIARYFIRIGINVNKISLISSLKQVPDDLTHLIVFENKLSGDIFKFVKKHNKKLLVIEENFLALNDYNMDEAILVSQYTYFGEELYNFVNKGKIPRILIVEDDYISIVLLKAMFANEYCEVDTAVNGQDGLELLTTALKNNSKYDIVYTDQNMPILKGSDMLKQYSELTVKDKSNKLVTVSISGEIDSSKELYNFDSYATKPFNKKEIISIFSKTIQNKKG